jgi:hypothetical protein
LDVWLSPTGLINLGFTTDRRLAVVLIIPSSWGSQLGAYNALSSNFSGTIAGEKEYFYKGSLSRSIIYFVIVLLYLIFA